MFYLGVPRSASARTGEAERAGIRWLKTERSAARAAQYPHMPWTPPPGGVELEQM
jgi:hypothetical protein